MTKPVFISYSTADTATTVQIRDHLEAQGIACWMAPRDIAPGEDYAEQIINAIEGCTVLLLVLSETSNHSQYVIKEVERAIAKRKLVIPFRIHDVAPSRSLEFFISNAQWIDAIQAPLAAHLSRLVQTIHQQLGQPAAPLPLLAAQPVTPSHNLPHQLTPFVGRTTELTALDALLADAQVRLVTILGPGGMGKTRLSLALAERHLTDVRFTDGIYFVALGALSTAEYILPTLAAALSLSLIAGNEAGTPQQQVLNYLRSKTMLLVFDNFEHLLEGAELVVQILQAAPHIQVVVTSRERLRVSGEHLFSLHGLDIGQSDQMAAAESAAVQLFCQSAQAVQSDLELNETELAHVVHICRLVGGMPLAIDLAAGWSEMLSPAEIVEEIRQSLDFLATEQRGGNAHHRSMRAVFDSTWQRLDEAERVVYRQLAVFRGGFTREAAEQVAGASLRLLSTLVGKSLIQHDRQLGRYTLHELLRQFAEEQLQLAPIEAEITQNQHCTYYATWLQQQELRLKGREQKGAMGEVEAEIDNLRRAWQWAIAHRRVDEIDHALNSLSVFYIDKCWYQEGGKLFHQAVAAMRVEQPTSSQEIVLGRLLAAQGEMQAWLQTEENTLPEEPIATLAESLRVLRRLGAQSQTGSALVNLGIMFCNVGNFERGLPLLHEALAVYAEQRDRWGMEQALHDLGQCNHRIGKYREAIQYLRQGIAICEESGDLRTLGDTLDDLGNTYRVLGDYAEATLAVQAALAARTAIGNRRGIARSLRLLGELAWLAGDFETARRRTLESLALVQEIGLVMSQNACLDTLGNIALSLGDYQRASGHFHTILASALQTSQLNSDRFVPMALVSMATVLAKIGRPAQALELLDHALCHPIIWQETKERAAKLVAEILVVTGGTTQQLVRSLEIVVTEVLAATRDARLHD